MKKRILSLVMLCGVLLSLCVPAAAATAFTVAGVVDFDNSTLTVTVETPAQYNQHILVTLYPQNADITDPTSIIRIADTFASREGLATLTLNLADLTMGFYTLSASGGGYLAESSHHAVDIYFETPTELATVTLPAVSTAEGTELDAQLTKLSDYFSLDLGTGYTEDSAAFLSLFEAVRADDFSDSLASMSEVQTVADSVNLIMTTLAATAQADLEALYEEKADLLQLDVNDTDYSENKAAVYSIYIPLVQQNVGSISDLSDLRTLLQQAIGMATLNTKNADNATATILKYGALYGIDVNAYNTLVSRHGAAAVNMDFIGRNFTTAAQVLGAYNDAVSALGATTESAGGLTSSRGSGGAGGGSVAAIAPAAEQEPVEETAAYSDVPVGHWAYEPVKALSAIGVLSGYEDGSFAPDAPVTREQFVKMLAAALGLPVPETVQLFEDVPAGHWAEAAIAAAADSGLVSGISETEFGLGSPLTRQDTAVLIDRVLTYLGIETAAGTADFTDWAQVGEYAGESVSRLCGAGILSGMGDGSFAPLASLTRAQAAKILHSVLLLR